jgi:hypothetical protein
VTSEQPPPGDDGVTVAPVGSASSVGAPSPGTAAPLLPIAGPEHLSDPRVEDALSRLRELEDLPLPEQIAVFGDIHRRLEGVLADPESRG